MRRIFRSLWLTPFIQILERPHLHRKNSFPSLLERVFFQVKPFYRRNDNMLIADYIQICHANAFCSRTHAIMNLGLVLFRIKNVKSTFEHDRNININIETPRTPNS